MKEILVSFYQSIIDKEQSFLEQMLDSNFQIIHINGMIQNKEQFINAILNESIVYISYEVISIQETKMDDRGVIAANIKATANLYNSGIKEWNISTKIALFEKEEWKIYRILETSYK